MTLPTQTSIYDLIKAAVAAGGVATFDHPATSLPTKPSGSVAQAAVLRPSAGLHQHTRFTGDSSGRLATVTVYCVGATNRDALAVADKVHLALNGLVLAGCSPLRQESRPDEPATEPGTDPVRVSMSVTYSTITKG